MRSCGGTVRMRTLPAALAALTAWACSSDPAARCTLDSQCGSGRVCDIGVCKSAGPRTAGEACSSDDTCSPGAGCATSMPGGLCTFNCAGDPCPSGAVCTDLRASGSGILCSKACTAQSDCRGGYTC